MIELCDEEGGITPLFVVADGKRYEVERVMRYFIVDLQAFFAYAEHARFFCCAYGVATPYPVSMRITNLYFTPVASPSYHGVYRAAEGRWNSACA